MSRLVMGELYLYLFKKKKICKEMFEHYFEVTGADLK